MKSKGIRWSCVLWQRRMPGDLLGPWNQVERRSRQRRHMKRLASMAGRFRPIRMSVKDCGAGGEIEQRHAAQHGQRTPPNTSPDAKPQ
jgi:hypothetical protein